MLNVVFYFDYFLFRKKYCNVDKFFIFVSGLLWRFKGLVYIYVY